MSHEQSRSPRSSRPSGPSSGDPWHEAAFGRSGRKDKTRRERSLSSDRSPPPPSSSKRNHRASSPSGTEILKAIQTGFQQNTEEIRTWVESRLQQTEAIQGEQGAQITDHEQRLMALCERVYEVETDISKWKTEKEEWFANPPPAFAPSPTAVPVASSSFDRPVDPTKVLISGGGKDISRRAVQECLNPLLEKANIGKECVAVVGKGIRKKFAICFEGPSAPKMVDQFIDSLKDDDGKWIPIHLPDVKENVVRVYISKDKSPKQEKKEILTGAMARIIKAALGEKTEDHDVYAIRHEGTVNIDWVPVFAIELPTEKDVLLQWNIPELEKLGLDKANLAQSFKDGGKKKTNIAWSL